MSQSLPISIILLDVLRGYSTLRKGNRKIFFKHFSYLDDLCLEEYEKEQFEHAVINGIKTEDQLIKEAISNNYWELQSEEKIKSLEWIVEKTENSIQKVSDNNQKKAFQKSVQKQKDELNALLKRRNSIIEYSAESFASGKRSYKLIEESLFVDDDLTKKANEEDYDDFIYLLRDRLQELSKEANLIKASYQGSFFDLFSLGYKDPFKLINRNLDNITLLQKRLLVYASILLNKLKNMNVPEEVRRDAMLLIDFNKEEESQSEKKTEGVEDLRKKMAKRGGKLKAGDLLG